MPGKAINYGRFVKFLSPDLGFDFEKQREALLKLKTMSEDEITDEMKAVRQAYFENRYEEACISQKLDMLAEDAIRLVHENLDLLIVKKGMDPHTVSLVQSLMKREDQRGELALKWEQLKVQRDLVSLQREAMRQQQLPGAVSVTALLTDDGTEPPSEPVEAELSALPDVPPQA